MLHATLDGGINGDFMDLNYELAITIRKCQRGKCSHPRPVVIVQRWIGDKEESLYPFKRMVQGRGIVEICLAGSRAGSLFADKLVRIARNEDDVRWCCEVEYMLGDATPKATGSGENAEFSVGHDEAEDTRSQTESLKLYLFE